MTRRNRIIVLSLVSLTAIGVTFVLTRDWQAPLQGALSRAERALGLSITIGGKTRLALLPPALTAEQVRLHKDGNDIATIGRLSLRLAPVSLFTGTLDVRGLAAEHLRLGSLDMDRIEARLDGRKVDGFTKINGHNLTFSAGIDAKDGKTASLRLSAPALGAALHFDGSLERDAEGPVLSGRLSLNSGELAAWAPHLDLPAGATLKAEADVEAGAGQLALVNLTMASLGSRAAGSVQVLAGSPTLAEADLEVDNLDLDAWRPVKTKTKTLTNLLPAALTPPEAAAKPPAPPLPPPANVAAAPVPVLPDLLANMTLTLHNLRWHGQTLHAIKIRAGLDQGQVVLRHAQADLGRDWRVNADGVLAGQDFKGRLRVNGPSLSGRADVAALWPRLDLTDIHLNRDGTFVRGTLSAQWADAVSAQWNGQIGSWSDTAATLRLIPVKDGFDAPDLALRIGTLAVQGQMHGDFSDPRPRIDAVLRGGDIDLKALPASPLAVPPPRAPKLLGRQKIPAGPAQPKPVAAPAKGAAPFSTVPLDWSALERVDGTWKVQAQSLSGDFGRLEQPALTAQLNNGTARIESFSAGYLGGTVNASGAASGGPVPTLRIDTKLSGLDMARLKPALAGLSVESGKISGTLRLHSFGKSSRDMAANAQGEGQIEGGPGSIGGVDLATIDSQLARLENIGNVLSLAQTGLGGGTTAYSRLSGRLIVKDGVVRSPDLLLAATGGSLGADGSIDLAQWSTESTVSLTLASLPATPIVLRLSGPLGNPRKVVDVNALQRALVQSGLGRALGKATGGDGQKGGGKILNNLFRAFGGKN